MTKQALRYPFVRAGHNRTVLERKKTGELFPLLLGQTCRWLTVNELQSFSRSAARITGSPRTTIHNHFSYIFTEKEMLTKGAKVFPLYTDQY